MNINVGILKQKADKFPHYYHLSNDLNVISKTFVNLRNKQITLFYKSSYFKVVMCIYEGLQWTRVYFGIDRKVKKSNWKWKRIQRNFGKSFYDFWLCTSWSSDCKVECILVHPKDYIKFINSWLSKKPQRQKLQWILQLLTRTSLLGTLLVHHGPVLGLIIFKIIVSIAIWALDETLYQVNDKIVDYNH